MSSTPVLKEKSENEKENSLSFFDKTEFEEEIRKLTEMFKEPIADSQDYSLLEDEVIPEFYDCSPKVISTNKSILKRLPSMLRNITFNDEKCVLDEVSDESFIRTEEIVKNECQDDTCLPVQNKADTIVENSENYSLEKMTDDLNLLNLNSDFKVESFHDSITEKKSDNLNLINHDNSSQIIKIKSNDSSDANLSDDNSSMTNSNNYITVIKCNENEEFRKSDEEQYTEDSIENSDETLKFNDTIEEMDYFMKHGKCQSPKVEKKPLQKNVITPKIILAAELSKKKKFFYSPRNLNKNTLSIVNTPKSSMLTPKYVNTPKSSVLTPKSKYNIKHKSNGRITGGHVDTPISFKAPAKSYMNSEKNCMLSPVNRELISNMSRKFTNVASPIKHYIDHSPKVPLLKNVNPINYWDRVPPKNVYQESKLIKRPGKENARLPETAYKSSDIVNVVEKEPVFRIPKSQKEVISIVKNLPKPTVIKHLRKPNVNIHSKYTNELAFSIKNNKNDAKNNIIEDSYTQLPENKIDMSYCIKKPAMKKPSAPYLMKNQKIQLEVKNEKKPLVIKHVKKSQSNDELNQNRLIVKEVRLSEDSFTHLPLKRNRSHHIIKSVIRSNTLK